MNTTSKLMFIVLILICNFSFAGPKSNDNFIPIINGHTRSNIHGGHNYYNGNKMIYYSRSNNFGGHNYYNGSILESTSRKNTFGGQTFIGNSSTKIKK